MAKIHPTALVESAEIGETTNVWAMVHIMSGVRVGNGCNIGDHTFLESGAVVGNNVTIKNQVLIWEGIVIEDDVFIGPRVTFTNDRYPRSPRMPQALPRYRSKSNWLESTTVRRGCSIGAGAIICPGVELGVFAVVAAGAVVTKSVGPFSLVRGTPARSVGHVCVCGHPLSGDWKTTNCEKCGQTGYDRQNFLASTISNVQQVEALLPGNHHKNQTGV
jgi:UDP-2-acetamido-3-amino-2,3-dideoxy-glucuronate N-acetyltransferase